MDDWEHDLHSFDNLGRKAETSRGSPLNYYLVANLEEVLNKLSR